MVGVSVVLPCLNEEQTIGICIDKAKKVFKEHNIDGEIIVSDNGSTDESVKIAKEKGARVVFEKRKGAGNAYLKGLIMAIVGFVATTLTDLETFNAAYVAIATSGFTIIYLGKNWFLPSVSDAWKADTIDLVSGLLVAIGMAVSSFAASIITIGSVDWGALGIAVTGAVVGYFAKTVPSKNRKKKK